MAANPHLIHSVMNGPVPGQSLTHSPKQMPFEQPPTFVKMEDAMGWLMDQMTGDQYMKQLLHMMDAGMPIEAITRTILFTGFATGKWTPDLAIMMYKPLMMSLIAIAHRAGITDVPLVMPAGLDQHIQNKTKMARMLQEFKGGPTKGEEPPMQPDSVENFGKGGYMDRRY